MGNWGLFFSFFLGFLKGLVLYGLGRWTPFKPPGVEILVPEPWNANLTVARLSPGGKKLLYVLSGLWGWSDKRYIFDLATGKKRALDPVYSSSRWIDDHLLLCGYYPNLLLNVEDFSTSPLEVVDARQEPFIHLFEGAHRAYKLGRRDEQTAYLLIGSPTETSVLIKELPQEFQPPSHVSVTNAGEWWAPRGEKVVSPDGTAYFIDRYTRIQIYASESDRLLRKVDLDQGGATVYGWSFDSRGVLYKLSAGPIDFRFEPHPIYSLTVPRDHPR